MDSSKTYAEGGKVKIGLALGGGGARGLAHIGVLKVLQGENIPIDAIAGTSMGGIIGCLHASGISVDEMEAEARRVGRRREQIKLIDPELTGLGLIKGTRLYRYLANMLGEDLTFADLHIPLALVAVDMLSGREVVLSEGKVVDAIRATISVPGIFIPYEIGGLRLVDGGVLNNVPADVARSLGVQVVIAVDVLPNFPRNELSQPPVVPPLRLPGLPTTAQELMHILMIMISELSEDRLRMAQPEVIIRPELPTDMGLFIGLGRVDAAITAGEAAAEQAMPQIRQALAQAVDRATAN
ncbi:MAG: patatin-like phospholipase family protein [Anaerolineales bacterium]|nr:patatin-like phospholipase family protein [Anaerolineales bacterium]